MLVVGSVGFADATYLTVHHYVDIPLPCSVLQSCETVLTSPWAMVGPVPLAAFGIVFYLAVLIALLAILTTNVVTRRLIYTNVALTTVGALMSFGFLSIQGFVIGAFCQYCVLSALCTFVLFAGAMKILQET